MNKKGIRVGILLVLGIILIGIGGKVFMDKRAEQKEQDLLAVEKQSVKVLKNTFADIKEVKFHEAGKNEITGSYGMYVTMFNKNNDSVKFDYGFWKERNELGDYGVEDEAVQKEGVTTTSVKVTYTNGKEELI